MSADLAIPGDRGDMALIDSARIVKPGNDRAQCKAGSWVHPESPFRATIARRAS